MQYPQVIENMGPESESPNIAVQDYLNLSSSQSTIIHMSLGRENSKLVEDILFEK